MKLIDKIILNRAIKTVLNFILSILKIFEKHIPENKPDSPLVPKPVNRPLQDLLDNILPWRK